MLRVIPERGPQDILAGERSDIDESRGVEGCRQTRPIEHGAVRVRLEQYYQDNRNYGSTAATCGVAMPGSPGFTFSCAWGPGGTSQSFLVTATGTSDLAGHVYTVDETDQQRTVEFAGTAVGASCWIKKSGETC